MRSDFSLNTTENQNVCPILSARSDVRKTQPTNGRVWTTDEGSIVGNTASLYDFIYPEFCPDEATLEMNLLWVHGYGPGRVSDGSRLALYLSSALRLSFSGMCILFFFVLCFSFFALIGAL